jgi:hypothetical protein
MTPIVIHRYSRVFVFTAFLPSYYTLVFTYDMFGFLNHTGNSGLKWCNSVYINTRTATNAYRMSSSGRFVATQNSA